MESYKIDVTEMSEQDKVRVQKAAFKLGYVWSNSKDNVINLQVGYYYLGRDGLLGWDWASSWYYFDKDYGRQITLQQLLKLAGMEDCMTTKQFSKKDLVAGKHVVELADGSRYLLVNVLDKIIGFNLQADSKGVHDSWYTYLEEGLVYPYNEDLNVVAVYKVISINVYCQCSESNIELVWQRTEKSATQIELEKLQQQIAELQDQVNKLQDTL